MDTRLFIGYSRNSETFFVRGRRDDTKISNYVPYGFECIYENDLYEFIKFVLGKSNANVILYNFNNIKGINDKEITYEFIENNMDPNYEIAGYDDYIPKRRELLNYFKILKNTSL